MKLELKHWSAYLPYGLKLLGKNTGINDLTISRLDFINSNETYFKPILHPLSDLTKEIEVNGERFVPMIRLASKIKLMSGYDFGKYTYTNMKKLIIQTLELEKGYDNLPHWIYQDLIKWHFNVFNLPDDLFIDINTIKQ